MGDIAALSGRPRARSARVIRFSTPILPRAGVRFDGRRLRYHPVIATVQIGQWFGGALPGLDDMADEDSMAAEFK